MLIRGESLHILPLCWSPERVIVQFAKIKDYYALQLPFNKLKFKDAIFIKLGNLLDSEF